MPLAVFSPIFLALACSVCASSRRAAIGEPRMCCRYLSMKAVTDVCVCVITMLHHAAKRWSLNNMRDHTWPCWTWTEDILI